jgi:hypothetical protein
MPALLGPLVGFALGVALAWLSRGQADRDDDEGLRTRAAVVGLFGTLIFAPACAYFLIFTSDWAHFYLVDSRSVPSALDLLLVVLDAAIVPVGFITARRAGRRRAYRALGAFGGVPAVTALALVLIFFPKLGIEGTFHQVRSNFGTQPVAGGRLGYAILWMNAMLVTGFALTFRALTGRAPPPPLPPSEPADIDAKAARPQLLGRRGRP